MSNSSLKLNFIMNFILTASSIIFPLITFPYVSRILGPEGTGNVAMGTSLVSYFTMIAMLGVPTYGVRACANVRDDKTELSRITQELLIINLVMALISYIAFFITIYLVPDFESQRTLYVICSLATILNVIGVNWLYQGLEQYSYITFISIIFKFIGLILMFVLVQQSDDYIMYGLITVIAGFGSSIFNFVRLKKFIYVKPVKNYNFKRHIKPIFTFFAMTVATTIYTNLDVVMLGVMKTNVDVGLYNAAVRIKTITVTLVTSLGTVLLPRLSYYFSQNNLEEFKFLVSKAFSFVLLLSVPCCIYMMYCAEPLILLLTGENFYGAIQPMIIITPTILLIGLSNITGIQILVPSGNEKLVLKSVVAGAVIDLIINLLLIPDMGASGAALGTLVAEFVVLLIQCIYLRDLIKVILHQIEFKPLLVSIIPAFVLLLIVNRVSYPNMFFRVFATGVTFFGVYLLGLVATKEEIVYSMVEKFREKFSN